MRFRLKRVSKAASRLGWERRARTSSIGNQPRMPMSILMFSMAGSATPSGDIALMQCTASSHNCKDGGLDRAVRRELTSLGTGCPKRPEVSRPTERHLQQVLPRELVANNRAGEAKVPATKPELGSGSKRPARHRNPARE